MSPSDDHLTRDLLHPLVNTSWRFYLLVALLASVVVAGVGSWAFQMWNGFGVTGIRWPIYWGFFITDFVFWTRESLGPARG